ncbi:hypothetical protein C8Q70DRAFT_1049902 [Cubamyces menziesii]|uniref:Uncharacterized protein n=1 Tax=Trametes cubensis TaxID=1111947 RepID=A0AAD7TMJ1_9APHY|nr:hypothetical protein C8Q70DRAFT_1049902 [Cubamyces menziesii]KAJ8469370.1 hypothetical protein ONZ51_g9044 [Trametes cubensis]
MPVKFALKTACYVAIVGVFGCDTRARAGIIFDDFVTALITIGFAWVPNTDNSVLVFQRIRAQGEEGSQQLRVPRPAASDEWWGFEYNEIAHALEDRFNINDANFVEIADDTIIEGAGFCILEWD